jgi:hypothetical protein
MPVVAAPALVLRDRDSKFSGALDEASGQMGSP